MATTHGAELGGTRQCLIDEPAVLRDLIRQTAQAPVAYQQSNTDQQMSFRNR